jgi:predicted AlkP superfamily pyrophosphatase or phosphodiesterase
LKRVAVINVVGLSESLLGPHTPRLNAFRKAGSFNRIHPVFPAVTCTAQATYLTGRLPAQHGIVGNGWYHRELAEVHFWKQAAGLVQAPKIWQALRSASPQFTCAQLFWWFNMYSGADWSITPRPVYPADGRKIFDIYSWPYSIRPEIKQALGEFPFPTFWGPAAGRNTSQGSADAASRWIAASAEWIERKFSPTLNLIYLPHLDYNLQRFGPGSPHVTEDLRLIDQIVGGLLDFFQERHVVPFVLSEYGISSVNTPVHLNRLFRQRGWQAIKNELGRELLDCGASRAFAVADHQVAHVYLNDLSLAKEVRTVLETQLGIAEIWGDTEKKARGLDHARSGNLIALAAPGAWFTYYYWFDDALAPDFARTVDIHRKPGYDPVELFLDPATPFIKAKMFWRLIQKKLGFRMLMDVIPLDGSLVKGSHGICPANETEWPLLIRPSAAQGSAATIEPAEVFSILQKQFQEETV